MAGIDSNTERRCKSFHGCQLVSKPDAPEPLRRSELLKQPWQHLATDLMGRLPSGDYFLVVVDYFSRYMEVAVTKSVASRKII